LGERAHRAEDARHLLRPRHHLGAALALEARERGVHLGELVAQLPGLGAGQPALRGGAELAERLVEPAQRLVALLLAGGDGGGAVSCPGGPAGWAWVGRPAGWLIAACLGSTLLAAGAGWTACGRDASWWPAPWPACLCCPPAVPWPACFCCPCAACFCWPPAC